MIIPSEDIPDWIEVSETDLIAAWTPEIVALLGWEPAYAEALARELWEDMLTTLRRGGTEKNFRKLVADRNIGLPLPLESEIAADFFDTNLRLARASHRHHQVAATLPGIPYTRAFTVGDNRTANTHQPLQDIVLPRDHSFWTRWHPPLGKKCRCGVLGMTRSQLARSKYKITSDEELAKCEAQLQDDWPEAFKPLLDFRRPILPTSRPKLIGSTDEERAPIPKPLD